jgi:hypothetical protein
MVLNIATRYLGVGGAVCWLGLLAGCQSSGNKDKKATAASAGAAAQAASPLATGPPYTGYHRYQGTVGGRPVTMMLTIGPDQYDSTKTVCAGTYYYGTARRGLLDLVNAGTYQPRQPMQLDESDGNKDSGTWRATQPVGPLLSGTWTSPSGKQLPFELREAYQDAQGHQLAVRYEVLHEATFGPVCQPGREEADSPADEETDSAADEELSDYEQQQRHPSELYRDALHLLGPDTLRHALRALQCLVPKQRRQAAQAFAADDGSCTETSESVSVAFNDFGLLSLSAPSYTYYYGAPHFNHSASSTTYDLRSGEEVTLENILRPGTNAKLQRLLTRHLLRDPHTEGDATVAKDAYELNGELVPLPAGIALSYTGLVCLYGEADIRASLGYVSLEVPYAEVVPLLRPNSPVARMLRERGLWR